MNSRQDDTKDHPALADLATELPLPDNWDEVRWQMELKNKEVHESKGPSLQPPSGHNTGDDGDIAIPAPPLLRRTSSNSVSAVLACCERSEGMTLWDR